VFVSGALLGAPATASAQDLYVKDFQIGVTGSTVTYEATVCNAGSTTTRSFDLEIYYHLTSAPGCTSVQSQTYVFSSGLAYGGCITRTFTRTGTPSGTYNGWARVDADCDISETNENNNNASRIYVVGSSSPDYYVDSFTTSTSGSTVTYTARFCNGGSSSSTPFDLEIYYDLPSAPGCTSVQSQTYRYYSGLAGGTCATRTFTRSGASSGTYIAWARADADCEVAESNELNNNRYRIYSVSPSRPDLYIDSFTTSVSGNKVTFTTTVCNGGAGTSIPFDIEIYYNRTSAPTCTTTSSQEFRLSYLDAGKCYTRYFTLTSATPGSYTAWVAVDADCKVAESNEGNNTAASAYQVGPTLPDLRVASFNVTVSGTTAQYTATVCNDGAATAKGFNLEVYYHLTSTPDCYTSYSRYYRFASGLPTGNCTTVTFTRTGISPGAYTGWARADANCEVAESNEANNNRSASYSVGRPDLQIASLTVSVSGSTVTYTAQVCNGGTSTSSPFSVGLFYDRSGAPGCSSSPNQTYTFSGGLASGICSYRTFVRTGVPVGSYKAWAMADSGCALTETNETNNTNSNSYVVGPTLPNLAVSIFTVSVSGTSVTYSITVCNRGKAIPASSSFDIELYYDRVSSPGCTSSESRNAKITTGLAYNACIKRVFTRSGVSSGSFTAWARADADCQITESNEADNNMSKPYSVGAVARPELYVNAFSVNVSGTTVTYEATVCNTGANSGAFSLGIYYNSNSGPTCGRTPDRSHTFSSGLIKGQCSTQTFIRTGAAPGSFTGWAFADSACKVAETSETNNTTSRAYSVVKQDPDLYVSNFTVSSVAGTTTMEATVCNQGKAAAPATVLGLYANRSTAPRCSDSPSATLAIKSLSPSTCDTQKTTLTALPAGPHVAWALADSRCVVSESNEVNNSIARTYVVPAQAVDAGPQDAEIVPDGIPRDTRPAPDQEQSEEDAGVQVDQGTGADRGVTTPGDEDGCNCRLAGSPSPAAPSLPGSALVLALVLSLALLRRRRR
jgi:subtilase family serine protease